MKKLFVIIILLLIASCSTVEELGGNGSHGIVEVGHGVYYFGMTGKRFAVELAKFSSQHEVVSIAQDGRWYKYGGCVGYFVVCKNNHSRTR